VRDHGRPSGRVLAPVFLGATLTHAESARTLVEEGRSGNLSTLAAEPAGYPFGSVVNYALDADANPLLLTSDLAEHTGNFKRDPRASLLVVEGGGGDPLAIGRVTLLGDVSPASDDAAHERYLARHPSAKMYVEFRDFNLYRLTVRAIRYIGGFGRMQWVEAEEYHAAAADPIHAHRRDIISHMNADHADAMVLLARHFADVSGTAATMVGVDRHGFEMSVLTEQGPRQVRLPFADDVNSPDEVRQSLIGMLREARAAQ